MVGFLPVSCLAFFSSVLLPLIPLHGSLWLPYNACTLARKLKKKKWKWKSRLVSHCNALWQMSFICIWIVMQQRLWKGCPDNWTVVSFSPLQFFKKVEMGSLSYEQYWWFSRPYLPLVKPFLATLFTLYASKSPNPGWRALLLLFTLFNIPNPGGRACKLLQMAHSTTV